MWGRRSDGTGRVASIFGDGIGLSWELYHYTVTPTLMHRVGTRQRSHILGIASTTLRSAFVSVPPSPLLRHVGPWLYRNYLRSGL
jgi:hypothetical protein